MDSGETIPGLNEDWTFAGAKAVEWMAGFVMLILCSEAFFDKPARAAPILVCIMIGTALGLALLRRSFPDEERGLRNYFMTMCGFEPPDIPCPANLQPTWSGAPMREMEKEKIFMQLQLDQLFPTTCHSGEENDTIKSPNADVKKVTGQ
jgi:hypothetical protein